MPDQQNPARSSEMVLGAEMRVRWDRLESCRRLVYERRNVTPRTSPALTWDQAEITHELTGHLEPPQVTHLDHDHDCRHQAHATKRLQLSDKRRQRPIWRKIQ